MSSPGRSMSRSLSSGGMICPSRSVREEDDAAFLAASDDAPLQEAVDAAEGLIIPAAGPGDPDLLGQFLPDLPGVPPVAVLPGGGGTGGVQQILPPGKAVGPGPLHQGGGGIPLLCDGGPHMAHLESSHFYLTESHACDIMRNPKK